MRPAAKAFLVAAALLVPLLVVFQAEPASAATNRVLAITNASAQPTVPFKGFDGNPPKVFDINGDGRLEIIAQNDNQFAYIFDSQTGKILAELKTVLPAGWGARSFNGPEVAITSADGPVRVILGNSAASVASYRFDPVASTTVKLAFVKEWQTRLDDCHPNPGMDAKPVLADLDRDGTFEIIAATEESGIYALRMDGSVLWKKCIGGGNAEPTVGDLNQDGWPDVVHGSDGGTVTAMNGRTGSTMWSYYATGAHNLGSGSMPVGVAIGQLDGLTGPDVVVGARDSHDPENWDNDHAALIALSSSGRLLWARQDADGGNPLTYTHAIIADADKDGTAEVYWGDWNTIGHKPPANEADSWKVTGPANYYRYDKAGNLVWKQSLGSFWSNKDVPIGDVDGDGVQEMLANGPGTNGHDGLWALDVRNGNKDSFIDLYPWKLARAPVLADLWGTGTMQLVVQAGQLDPSAGGAAVLVYDTHNPMNAVWPHLPDPRLGSIAPPPPPPAGGFDATFTIKSPNEYWQEVVVKPATTRTITEVSVRIAGGPWEDMTKSSWGAWTTSQQARAGTTVEFLAKDANNYQSQSLPFTWMDGTLSKGSTTPGTPPPPPPPPPPGEFDASFTVPTGVNEWWVEVRTTANQPVSRVDVKVGSGDWVQLAKTDWGTWAKSMFVRSGSLVQFRATASDGATDLSTPSNWLGGTPPPPPPDTFTVTFTPKQQSNPWWVETAVASAQPVPKVEFQINGGSWQALTHTDWGTWAKSVAAPAGTQVRFRATNDGGATALSGVYVWGS